MRTVDPIHGSPHKILQKSFSFREKKIEKKKRFFSKMQRRKKTVKNETGDVTVRNAVVNNPTHGDGQSDINVSMKNMTVCDLFNFPIFLKLISRKSKTVINNKFRLMELTITGESILHR